MNKLKVDLLHHTPLRIALFSIKTCYESEKCPINKDTANTDELVDKDKDLLKRILESKHESTIEHISYNFYIQNITRAVLQELARHRLASYSVKSTRYTVSKDLRKETVINEEVAKKYMRLEESTKERQLHQLQILYDFIKETNSKSDNVKMLLPESWLVKLSWTINARSLRNFLHLRSASGAWYQIRELANAVYEQIPEQHRILFDDILPQPEVSTSN